MIIQKKLTIFPVVLTILMVVISLLIMMLISNSIIRKQIGNHLWTTVQSRGSHIETLLNNYKKMVVMMASGNAYRGAVDEKLDYTLGQQRINKRINNVINSYPEIERMRILNKKGTVIHSSTKDIGFDKSDKAIFQKGRENSYIGEIHKSEFSGNIVISISTPILVRKKFSGVLVVNFDVERELYGLLTDRTGMGETGETYLVNKDHYMVSPSVYNDSMFLKTKINTKQVNLCFSKHLEKGLINKVQEEAIIYPDYRGKKVLGIHNFIPEMEWALIAEFDFEEAYRPINKLIVLVVVIFTVLLVITIIISIQISKNITMPIVDLHQGVEEIIKGNFDYKVGTDGKDEIGHLSRVFDLMTVRLAESQNNIQKHTNELENKVKKRTNELQETNVQLQEQLVIEKQSEEKLRLERDNLNSIFEAMEDGVCIINQQYEIEYVNKAFEKSLGPTKNRKCYTYFHDRLEVCLSCKFNDIHRKETIRRRWDSTKNDKIYDIIYTALKHSDGSISILEIFRDITAQMQVEDQINASLKEKETLLHEIHHRVKNNMTVISSLLWLQANSMEDKRLKEALMDSQNRVQLMSIIHETLYRSDTLAAIDLKTYLSELGRIIIQNYSISNKVQLKVEAENIMISVKQASPVGLIVNELIANCLKYAFTDDGEGEIVLSLKSIKENGIELTVSDNGVGIPEDFDLKTADSLGLKLVKLLAEKQLGGSIDIESKNGTKFTIKFNIET